MAKAMTEEAIPDLHHKMCKKIAQLTKVIFHLHSKNEDHDNQMREQAETYEIQIEEMLRDSQTKIADLKSKLAARENQLESMKTNHLEERQKVMDAFEALEKKYRDREVLAQVESQAKIDQMTRSFADNLDQFQKRAAAFERTTREMEESHARDIQQISERFKTSLQEQIDLEKEKTVFEMTENHKLEAAQMVQEYNKKLEDKENRYNLLKLELDTAKKDHLFQKEQWEVSRAKYEMAQSQFSHEKEELDSQLQLLQVQLGKNTEASTKLNSLQLEYARVNSAKFALEKELATKVNELDSARMIIRQRDKEQLEKEEENEKNIKKLAAQEIFLSQQLDKKLKFIADLESKHETDTERIKEQTTELSRLNAYIEKQEADHTEEKNRYESLIGQLAPRVEELEKQTRSLTETKMELETELTKDRAKHAAEQARFDKMMNAINGRLKQAAEDAAAIEGKEKAMNEAMASLKEHYETRLKDLETKKNDQLRDNHLLIERLKHEKDDATSHFRHIMKQMKDDSDALHTQLIELRKKKVDLEEKIANYEKELTLSQLRYTDEIENLKMQLTQQHESELAQRMSVMEDQLRQLITNEVTLEIEKKERAFLAEVLEERSRKDAELAQEILNLKGKLSEYEIHTVALIEGHKKQLEDKMEEFDQKTLELKDQFYVSTQRLKHDHVSATEMMKEQYETEIENLKLEFRTRTSILIETYTKEIDELNVKLVVLQEEESVKFAKMVKEKEDLLKYQGEEHEVAVSRLKTQIEESQRRVDSLTNASMAKEEKILKMARDIQRLEHTQTKLSRELEQKEVEILDTKKDAQASLKAKERVMLTELEERLKGQESDHQRELARLGDHQTKFREIMEDRMRKLEMDLILERARYENRESLPSDVQTIKELSDDLSTLRKKYEKLKREVDLVKMDMMNKEVSYNKLFGNSPKIGFLDPKESMQKSKKVGSGTMLPPLSPHEKLRATSPR